MPPVPSTQATPPIIGTADWPMRAARHAGQAPRAPASTSPPALTAIVWIWQCRGDRQPGDLRCLGRAPAHPHFRPVVARGNYGRPGPGNQLCEPERPRAPREPALNSRHRSSPVRTAQGRRSTSRWCVPIGGYTRRLPEQIATLRNARWTNTASSAPRCPATPSLHSSKGRVSRSW